MDELSGYLSKENPESYKRCKMTSLSDMAANGTDLASLPGVGHIFRSSADRDSRRSADCSSEASQEVSTVRAGSKSSAASVSSHTTSMSSCADSSPSPPGTPPGDFCSEQPEAQPGSDTQGTEHILASLSQAPSQALLRAAEGSTGGTASVASNMTPASDVWQGPLVVSPPVALPALPVLPALPALPVLSAEQRAEAVSLASVGAPSMHAVIAQLPLVQGIFPYPGQGVIRLQQGVQSVPP